MPIAVLGASFKAVPLWSHARTRAGLAAGFASNNALDGTFVALATDALGRPLDRCRSRV
jgi:hypothetical protein